MKKEIIIQSINIEKKDQESILSYEVVNFDGSPHNLYFSINTGNSEAFTESYDPAIISLLLPAMRSGIGIHVDGKASATLLHNINNGAQQLLKRLIPDLKIISLTAKEPHEKDYKGSGVACGYSAGIDSYSVIADHRTSPKQTRITHLLYNNVGSHGSGPQSETLFNMRHQRLVGAAVELQLPLLKVNTNINEFYPKGLGFQLTHTMRNSAVAHALTGLIGRFIYASTFPYESLKISRTYDIAYADPILLGLLSKPNLSCISYGSHLSRVEKTIRLTKVPHSESHLDVCVNEAPSKENINCGKCWKCMRTIATLESLGLLEQFKQAFHLKHYFLFRNFYLAKVLSSQDPLLKEISETIRQKPRMENLTAWLIYATQIPRLLYWRRSISLSLRNLIKNFRART